MNDEEEFKKHNRFVAGTTLLHDFLIYLGYELKNIDTKGPGCTHSRPIKTYENGNKVVIDAYDWVELVTELPGNKPKKEYRGGTVSKDILTFFSQRQKVEVKIDETDI